MSRARKMSSLCRQIKRQRTLKEHQKVSINCSTFRSYCSTIRKKRSSDLPMLSNLYTILFPTTLCYLWEMIQNIKFLLITIHFKCQKLLIAPHLSHFFGVSAGSNGLRLNDVVISLFHITGETCNTMFQEYSQFLFRLSCNSRDKIHID